MKRRYRPQVENTWVQPVCEGYRMRCCDCGLVHELDFRINDEFSVDQRVQFRARRNERATATSRAKARFPYVAPPPEVPAEVLDLLQRMRAASDHYGAINAHIRGLLRDGASVIASLLAQAGKAGTAETSEAGSVHEHAVAAGDAPEPR